MTIKRAPPKIVLSLEEQRRVKAFLLLLIAIDKRIKAQKQGRKNDDQRKSYYIGSRMRGPCFYLQLIYGKAVRTCNLCLHLW